MTRSVPAVAILTFVWGGLAGCGGESSRGVAWQGTVDTVDGVIVVANPAEPMLDGEDAWRLEEELDIGVIDGDPDYQFGSISDVIVDESGNIYVLDAQARRVMVYDSTGMFVHGFGRQGEGPGEFENPTTLIWRADTLVVWDWRLRRLSYLDRHGTMLRDERVDLPFGFNPRRFLSDGRVLAQRGPGFSMPIRPEQDGIGWILALDLADPSAADTLLRWQTGAFTPLRGERFMLMINTVYAPQLAWAADSDGRIYVARGESYEIEVYSPSGERLKTIRRVYTRFPPNAAEHERARARHEERAEQFGANADLYRKSFQIADLKTATADVLVSDAGGLWVRVSAADDLESWTWDVFDAEGRYVTALETPPRLEIHAIIDDHLYAELPDDLDVPHVKRFRIVRPEAAGAT